MSDETPGHVVVISEDRLAAIELSVFAGLGARDIVRLATTDAIVTHLAQSAIEPALFLVDAAWVDAAQAELEFASLGHLPVIAI